MYVAVCVRINLRFNSLVSYVLVKDLAGIYRLEGSKQLEYERLKYSRFDSQEHLSFGV